MKRAIIDLSSVIWTCLLQGTDNDQGIKLVKLGDEVHPALSPEGLALAKNPDAKRVVVNSAGYGFESSIDSILGAIEDLQIQPRDVILVKEGMNSKADRQALLSTYKSGRDKLPQQYEEFQKCRDAVIEAFTSIGANVVWQDGGVEADDVIAYLALHLKGQRYIVSSDKDMAALIDPANGIHHWRMGSLDKNPFGEFPHRFIPVYLSLVGDNGDGIPGAKGFGKVAFAELEAVFGAEGLAVMADLLKQRKLHMLAEDLASMPKLQKILDSADQVYTSYELARLRVDAVNTVKRPLQWQAGMVKLRTERTDKRLAKYAGQTMLVTQENYAKVAAWAMPRVAVSPSVALDIETSTPPESDEWLEAMNKSEDKTPVDVFGSELTGLSLTFGLNHQYTVYLTHDHVEAPGATNLTIGQVRDFVDMVPRSLITYVHNAAFELPVCFTEWGKDWEADPEYHGFLRNVRDTLIGASYMDENKSKGLKAQSAIVLNYTQTTYEEVTTVPMSEGEYNDRCANGVVGRIVQRAEEEGAPTLVQVQYKMNQLPASDVLDYGCDDTICTSALSNIQRIIMEIENTWDIYEEVETFPAYVTAKAFVDGVDFSLETMREMEKEDDATYDAAWVVLREYLIKIGYDGTVCPTFTELTPANIKEALTILGATKVDFKVRNLDKIAKWINQSIDDLSTDGDVQGRLLTAAAAIDNNDVSAINQLMALSFVGEPTLDLNSPKQMCEFLYDRLKLPVNITNDVTSLEHKHNPALSEAIREHKNWRRGKVSTLSPETWALVRKKAKANDDAIDYALAFDSDHLDDESRAALKAVGQMKKVLTRRQLFYKNYWTILHWKDGKIHASINQCAAVTRRYSASNPNLQQLPKKGDGVRFRAGFKPHHKDAVVCSIDYTGQELRLAAEESQDPNMLACYIGSKLKDIHHITAAGAMRLKWGDGEVDRLFLMYDRELRGQPDGEYDIFAKVHKIYKEDNTHKDGKMCDDLRKDAKNVNFGAQNGAQDLKLSETLIMRPKDAQLFLDARSAMFPEVDKTAKRIETETKKLGYATTMMGARRHLREEISSDNSQVSSRAARQAWNFKIQGSAGEMTKLGIGRLWKSGALHKFDVRFIAPVHDELLTSVHKDHAVDFIKAKSDAMTGPYAKMKVPILASVSIGPNLKDQIECGDYYNAEAIRKALDKIFHREEATA